MVVVLVFMYVEKHGDMVLCLRLARESRPDAAQASNGAMETEPLDVYSDRDSVLLTLIIKPFRLDAVLNALKPFHLHSLTASEVRGYGRQKGHLELYRGSEYAISFIPKVKIEVLAPSEEAPEIISAAQMAARTGRIGDGKIFVQNIENTVLLD